MVGVAAFTPFIVYYLVRLDAEIHRTVAVATAAEVWRPARLVEWFTNVRAALGLTAVAAAVALLFVITIRHVMWALTAIGLTVFFFVDVLGIPWTGYSRYLAFSLVALAGGVFATMYRLTDRRVLIAIPVVMAALQAWPVARTLALDFRPDYERNSMEWNGSLVRLPIRALIEKLPAFPVNPLRVRVVTFGIELTSLQVAYPDLANRYELQRGDVNASPSECVCRDNSEAVLAAFVWPAHFGDTTDARSAFDMLGPACVKQVEATCAAVEVERDRRGAPVGVIAVGVR